LFEYHPSNDQLVNKVEHFNFIKQHVLDVLFSEPHGPDNNRQISNIIKVIPEYLRLFKSLEITDDIDYEAIDSVVKVIRGYNSIVESKDHKSFDFTAENVSSESNMEDDYLKTKTFSDTIAQLNIKSLIILESDIKLLAAETPNEFEHLLGILEQYAKSISEEGEHKEFAHSLKTLRNAFESKDREEWNEAIAKSKTIQAWDVKNSDPIRVKSYDTGHDLELNLYFMDNEYITPISIEQTSRHKQKYIKARIVEKLKRLFNTRINMVSDALDVFKIYISTDIKPTLDELLRVLMEEATLPQEGKKDDEIEMNHIPVGIGNNVAKKLRVIEDVVKKDRKATADNVHEFNQIQNQIEKISKLISVNSELNHKKYGNHIFNLIKSIRLKYFSALHELGIEKLRQEIAMLKKNLNERLGEYIILFRHQFDKIYNDLKPKLDAQMSQLSEKYNNNKDVVTERMFMEPYKHVLGKIRQSGDVKILDEEMKKINELNNSLKFYKSAKGDENRKILATISEKHLLNYFNFKNFDLRINLEHYTKFSTRLAVILAELNVLYNTELEFSNKKVLLRNVSHFEIKDEESSKDSNKRLITIYLFDKKQELKFEVTSLNYNILKPYITSLGLTITKWLLYFGKDEISQFNYGNDLIYYDSVGSAANKIKVRETNSLIFSYLNSVYYRERFKNIL
jgi:hypothetical protein